MTDMTKNLSYYESLPYTVVVRRDEEGDFVAKIQELPGCVAHGESDAIAIEQLRSMQKLWLEDALSAGDVIPEPEAEEILPSGKWVQRVPRKLHRDLTRLAQRENVSLNQLVTSMLSEALTVRSCTHAFEHFLASMPVARASRGVMNHLWWGSGEHPHEMVGWSIKSHAVTGNIIQRISRVKNLKSSDVLPRSTNLCDFILGGTIDEHVEGYKHLARK
jgi:predicted RNase H-like HicB family nuclease